MINAFPKLELVGGRLHIESNFSLPASMEGAFPVLETVGTTLEIEDNHGLMTIEDAFASLVRIGSAGNNHHISIVGNSSLQSINNSFPVLEEVGYVEIFYCPELISINNFLNNAIMYTTGGDQARIDISLNDNLVSITNSFNSLDNLYTVDFYQNPVLENITDTLNGWTTSVPVDSQLNIIRNAGFNLVNTFTNLTEINVITIDGNGFDGIGNLDESFPALTSASSITIEDCPNLVSISGLCRNLTACHEVLEDEDLLGYIDILSCSGLSTIIDSFNSLVSLGRLSFNTINIFNFDSNFENLEQLRSQDESIGNLSIQNCPSLAEISFPSLTKIGKLLKIESNILLEDISQLQQIDGSEFTHVNSEISIINNPLLPETSMVQALIDNLTGEGFAGISANTGNLVEYFIPTENLQGHYDASISESITITSGRVSQWADLSGNARHLANASPSNRPVYPSPILGVEFSDDGATKTFLDSTVGMGSFVTSTLFTAYAVIKINAINNGDSPQFYRNDGVASDAEGGQLQMVVGGTYPSDPRARFFGAASCERPFSPLDGTAPQVITWRHGSGTIGISCNGSAETTASLGTRIVSGVLRVGGQQSAAPGRFQGYIREFLIYNTEHDASTIADLVAFLKTKWSIA